MKKNFYRVWRRDDGRYHGFMELEAETAEEAVNIVCDIDYDNGDTAVYTYVVDRIEGLGGDAGVLEYCGEF